MYNKETVIICLFCLFLEVLVFPQSTFSCQSEHDFWINYEKDINCEPFIYVDKEINLIIDNYVDSIRNSTKQMVILIETNINAGLVDYTVYEKSNKKNIVMNCTKKGTSVIEKTKKLSQPLKIPNFKVESGFFSNTTGMDCNSYFLYVFDKNKEYHFSFYLLDGEKYLNPKKQIKKFLELAQNCE